jgi:ABC-type antimicrobial peptide transport system permease subunit
VSLGVVGLYGTLAYVLAQRRREIAIRLAVGARIGTVVGAFVRSGAGLALAGVAVGLAAALGITRLLGSVLYGVSPLDLPTFAAVSIGLLGVAVAASYLPARRAARIDPMIVLREE